MKKEEYKNINIYDFYKFSEYRGFVRGAGVITNKQLMFCKEPNGAYVTHNDIVMDIEKMFYDYLSSKDIGWGLDSNVHFFSTGHDLFIHLPYSTEFGLSQYYFLCDILDMVDKFNNEVKEDKQIEVLITTSRPGFFTNCTPKKSTEGLREELKKMVTKNITVRKEKIVGTVLEQEKVQSILLNYISIDKCCNLEELINKILSINKYYIDDYYHDVFYKIFPVYEEVYSIISFFKSIGITSLPVSNLSFENVLDFLTDIIDNVFNYQNFDTIISAIHRYSYSNEKFVDNYFPNFKLFYSLIWNYRKERPDIFKNISNYGEISKKVFELEYSEKKSELTKETDNLNEYIDKLGDLEKKKYFLQYKTQFDEIYDIYCELRRNSSEKQSMLSLINNYISDNAVKKRELEMSLDSISKGVLSGLLNRRTINSLNNQQKIVDEKSIQLQAEKEELCKAIEVFNNKMSRLEEQFRNITLSNISLDDYYRDYSYLSFDTVESQINTIRSLIGYCSDSIDRIENNIEEISDTSVVDIQKEDKKVTYNSILR